MMIVATQRVPITRWQDGSIRIGDTRVLLDIVVGAFNNGRSPEEIVLAYPTLKLSEVYAVIAYYLDHQDDINDYVVQREREAEEWWQKVETSPVYRQFHNRLLARIEALSRS